MRVLVTGGSGYVGSYVVQELVRAGHEVISLSRQTPQPQAKKSFLIDLGGALSVKTLSDNIERCDAIVHAAAAISHEDWQSEITGVNCTGTQAMLQLAAQWKVSRFIYLSSISVIGVPKTLPVDELHPVKPASVYAASKLFGEYLTDILYQTQGIPSLSLRLTSPVGPFAPQNRIFSTFVRNAARGESLKLIGKGGRRQNYVDVRDVAVLVCKSLELPVSGIMNAGGSESISNIALAKLCVSVLGSSSRIEFLDRSDPEENNHWDISIEKARKESGYVPHHSLSDSILATAKTL